MNAWACHRESDVTGLRYSEFLKLSWWVSWESSAAQAGPQQKPRRPVLGEAASEISTQPCRARRGSESLRIQDQKWHKEVGRNKGGNEKQNKKKKL